jgi:hypothetical protein
MTRKHAQVHETTALVAVSPETAKDVVLSALRSGDGYQVAFGAGGSLVLSRSYRPRWATVVGIVTAIPMVGLGLLFLLVRRTESCTITIMDSPRGCSIIVDGQLSETVLARVRAALASRSVGPAQQAVVLGTYAPPPTEAAPPAPFPNLAQEVFDNDLDLTVARPSRTWRDAPPPPPAAPLRLVLDSGEVIPVDQGVVVGRSPTTPHGGDRVRPVSVQDEGSSISKTHFCVRPVAGGVVVDDLHSTNGTSIRRADGTKQRLVPGHPEPAPIGSVVIFGDRHAEVHGA